MEVNKKSIIIAVIVFVLTTIWGSTLLYTDISLQTILFAKYSELLSSILSIKFLVIAVLSAATFGLIISFSDENITREVVIASTASMLAVLVLSIVLGGGLYALIFGVIYVGAIYLMLRLSKSRHAKLEPIHSNLWRTSKTAITVVAIAVFVISAIVIANDRDTYFGEFERQVLTISLAEEEASMEQVLKDYYITGGKNVLERLTTRPEYESIGSKDSFECQAIKTEIDFLDQEYKRGILEDELISMFAESKEEDIRKQIRETRPIVGLLEDYFPLFGALLIAAVADLLGIVIAVLTVVLGYLIYFAKKKTGESPKKPGPIEKTVEPEKKEEKEEKAPKTGEPGKGLGIEEFKLK